MTEPLVPMLYDPRYDDSSVALQRCVEMTAFLRDALWQEKAPDGHGSYPLSFSPAGVSGFVWWLSLLQATLDDLYVRACTSRDAALVEALVGYLVQHPQQAAALRTILIEATERGFADWNRVTALITSPDGPSETKT